MNHIITHPGGAHKDDFLACSLLIAENPTPIFRRDPTAEELADATIAVIDVGGEHDPALLNFDHHQFPRDYTPTCALSLVLQHLELYGDARLFCPWLETAEWIDARGPWQAAQWLGVEPIAVTRLSSPLDAALLRYFSRETELAPGHPIWELMREIGADMLNYIRTLRANLDALTPHVSLWSFGELTACYLPRTDALAPAAADALDMWVRFQEDTIHATVRPDARGTGFGLKRFDDDLRLDFTRTGEEPDVHFAHKQGFIAKTTATDPERLKELLRLALV